MNERERAERFERQLTSSMKEHQMPSEDLSPEEHADLQLARHLLESDFSAGSRLRDDLRQRLIEANARKRPGDHPSGLFQGLAWAAAGLALVLLLSWSIGNLRPQPAITQAVVAPEETSAPGAQTPTLEPSPTPALPEITAPLASAANIRDITWSPDGGWVGFLTQDAAQFQNSPGGEGYMPPLEGTLHFTRLESEESCTYSVDNPLGMDFYRWYGFSPNDGSWLVIGRAGEILRLTDPCNTQTLRRLDMPEAVTDVYALEKPGGMADAGSYIFHGQSGCWLYDSNGDLTLALPECSRETSISTARGFLGMTLTEDGVAHRSIIIDTASGVTVFEHDWTFSEGGLGFLPAPQWITETQFIVYRSDEGPLLVSLASEPAITHIAPDLFGLQGAAHQYAYGQTTPEGNTHIVLTDLGADYNRTDTYIYHMESGQVEALPEGTRLLSFSQDGSALELLRSEDVDGYEQILRYVHPLDSLGGPEAALEPYVPLGPFEGTASPDGRMRVEITPAQIVPGYHLDLYSTETEDSLQHWLVRDYQPERFSWSPYRNALVAIGSEPQSGTQAIYLLKYR